MFNMADAESLVDSLYEEGDRDILFLGQILGAVSYGPSDVPVDKPPQARFDDAMNAVRCMVSSGDFALGRTVVDYTENTPYKLVDGGFDEFLAIARARMSIGGIDDIDLNAGLWLQKMRPGAAVPSVRRELARHFLNR